MSEGLTWTVLLLPHVGISAALLVVLTVQGIRARRFPRLTDIVEAAAYGSGLYGAWSLFTMGTKHKPDDQGGVGWALVAGSFVLATVAVKGISKTIRRAARRDRKPPAAGPPPGDE